MTKDNPTTVIFKKDKETPGTIRYQEVDGSDAPLKAANGAVVGTLYIRKTALNGVVHERLSVTITPQ